MSRRKLLGASVAAGGAALAAPAVAQEDKATIEWKMVTSWPKNLPGPGVTAQRIANQVEMMSGGLFRIRLFLPRASWCRRSAFSKPSPATPPRWPIRPRSSGRARYLLRSFFHCNPVRASAP
ncbi:hypothetical protein QW131_14165 [Roseibium salinum]|nr:hypothetical protein [Roseibium salinum]